MPSTRPRHWTSIASSYWSVTPQLCSVTLSGYWEQLSQIFQMSLWAYQHALVLAFPLIKTSSSAFGSVGATKPALTSWLSRPFQRTSWCCATSGSSLVTVTAHSSRFLSYSKQTARELRRLLGSGQTAYLRRSGCLLVFWLGYQLSVLHPFDSTCFDVRTSRRS